MAKISTIAQMDLVGGAACIDFVNTALEHDLPVERLHTYDDLLVLIQRLSLLDEDIVVALKRLSNADSEQAEQALLKARQVREAIRNVVAALAGRQLPQLANQALAAFNGHTQEALCKREFKPLNNQLAIGWGALGKDLMQAVWVFSLSAYELLTSQDQTLLKQCGGCGWFFLDQTKNHRRKWCAMQGCGTNQKARRYYQRKKQTPTA